MFKDLQFEFKAWDLKNKKWLDDEIQEIASTEEEFRKLVWCDMEGLGVLHNGDLVLLDECGSYVFLDKERFKLCFYLNAKDKYGKKIFSCDIVKFFNPDFPEDAAYFIPRDFYYNKYLKLPEYCQIIGNIFEDEDIVEDKFRTIEKGVI